MKIRNLLLFFFVFAVGFLFGQSRIIQHSVTMYLKQVGSPGLPPSGSAYVYLDSTNHLVCILPDGSSCL